MNVKSWPVSALAAIALAFSSMPTHAGGRGGSHSARGGGHFSGGHFSGARSGGSRFVGVHRAAPRVGVVVGVPAYRYYAPSYYYPPAYYAPGYYHNYSDQYQSEYASPPVYIEQGAGQAAPDNNWWYYCPGSQTYFPYVQECPGGWQRVVPQPPPPA